MPIDPFFANFQPAAPLFSASGFRTGVVALSQGPVTIYLAPGPATLLQVQLAVSSAIAGGTLLCEISTLNLDTFAITLVATRTLDATHTDEVILLALALSPRLAVAVLHTASVDYLGADTLIATMTGTLDG